MYIWDTKSIDDELCSYVLSKWPQPCEEAFIYIANKNINQLANIIRYSNLASYDLTLAVEYFGNAIEDSNAARDILIPLLQNDSALVREGVIYGLENHINEEVINIFAEMSESDPSKEIRNILKSTIGYIIQEDCENKNILFNNFNSRRITLL